MRERAILERELALLSAPERESFGGGTAVAGPLPYGGYDLKRGDRDSSNRYGGAAHPGAGGFVRQLQEDLRTLGFRIVGTPDGAFGRQTEWAVREFQIYASMERVAQESGAGGQYIDRLTGIANTHRYNGTVSGVVNADTRDRIRQWLADRWRCPVVIDARDASGKVVHRENVWLHDEMRDTGPRVFVRDFTHYYSFPAGRDPDGLIVLGDYTVYRRWSGPRSLPPRHTWPEAELLPEALVGTPLGRLSASQRSTFKVVRALAEQECLGFFDSANAYDNAFISVGPCHWTLGIADGSGVSEGELCAYLAYLRHVDPLAFQIAIGRFGVRADENWVGPSGVPNGSDLFDPGQRNYGGWVAMQQQNGTFARLGPSEDEGNYFKTWHWFYRFVMAGRTVEGYRRRMWDMVRLRLRDLKATPFPAGVVPDVPLATGGTRRATLGDVYTSERAWGLLLRWHVRFTSHVVRTRVVGAHVQNAVRRAAIPAAAGDPTRWKNSHEQQLIDGLMREVDALVAANANRAGFKSTMEQVRDWPRWARPGATNPRGYALDPTIGNLALTRGSFQFDDAGLPPSP